MKTNNKIPSEHLLKELAYFEQFFKRLGLKNIDGAIYGLLVLSEEALTSVEIEEYLSISQSAVSISLKKLSEVGAIESFDSTDDRRLKLHRAKENSLEVISSLFRLREEMAVMQFKRMLERSLTQVPAGSMASKRLNSLILACELAQTMMKFVHKMADLSLKDQRLEQIVKTLPQILDWAYQGSDAITGVTNVVKTKFSQKWRQGLSRFLSE